MKKILPTPAETLTRMSKRFSNITKMIAIPENILVVTSKFFLPLTGETNETQSDLFDPNSQLFSYFCFHLFQQNFNFNYSKELKLSFIKNPENMK